MALMDANATVGRVVWPGVVIGNFLFVYSGQSVRVVVVGVCIEFPQKRRNMVVEFLVSGFPTERHNDMLVDKRRVRDNPGFFVVALIERNS